MTPSKQRIELKSCPFCGCKEIAIREMPHVWDCPEFAAQCRSCLVINGTALSEDGAIKAWNTRAPTSCELSKQRIERAAEALKPLNWLTPPQGIDLTRAAITVLEADDSAAWQIAEKLAGALELTRKQLAYTCGNINHVGYREDEFVKYPKHVLQVWYVGADKAEAEAREALLRWQEERKDDGK